MNAYTKMQHSSLAPRSFTVIERTAETCADDVNAALHGAAAASPQSSTAVVSIDAAYHFNTRSKFLQDAATWVTRGNTCVLVDVVLPPPVSPPGPPDRAWTCSVSDAKVPQGDGLGTIPVQHWRVPAEHGLSPPEGGVEGRGVHSTAGAPTAPEHALLHRACSAMHAQTGQLHAGICVHRSVPHSLAVLCSGSGPHSEGPSRLASALGVPSWNQVTPAQLCAGCIASGFDHAAVLDVTECVWRRWAQWAVARQAPQLFAAGRLKDAATVAVLGLFVHAALAHGLFLRVVLVVAQRSTVVVPPSPLPPSTNGVKGGRARTPHRPRPRRVSFSSSPPDAFPV